MVNFLKKYKAFGIGFIIVLLAIILMQHYKFLLIPDDAPVEIFFVFVFWWLLVSLPIYKMSYLKKKRKIIYKFLILIILFIITMIIDSYMKMPDNPITFLLLMVFWIGIVYLLAPVFLLKYWKLIVLFYIPLLLYFIYLRLFSGDLEAYLKIKNDFSFVIFFVPIPIFFGLWFYEQWKWLKNLKAEKSQAELSLLRTQINPHFFFNTLNNLYALTVKNSKQAPEVILKLSDMMRYTIYEGEKETVKLGDEITYLKNYIELHKIRYKKSVEITFNHTINTELTVAPLLFIILLENAFKHGIETLTENAYIHINLHEVNNYICFIVENNFDSKEINESTGIGLKNLKRRLSLLYKDQHDLSINKTENTYKTILKVKKHA